MAKHRKEKGRAESIADAVYETEYRKPYDAVCSALTGDNWIRAYILAAALPLFGQYAISDIANWKSLSQRQMSRSLLSSTNVKEGTITRMDTVIKSVNGGTMILDQFYRVCLPNGRPDSQILVNVELQNNTHPGYRISDRALAHIWKIGSEQRGRDYVPANYSPLLSVASIWIFTDPPKKYANQLIIEAFPQKVASEPKQFIAFIYLGGPVNDRYKGIFKLLHVLLSSEMSAQKKCRILQEEFEIPISTTFRKEVESMCNLSQGVFEKGERQGMAKGIAKGMTKGMAKGLRQGMAKERDRATMKFIQNLMSMENIPLLRAMELAGVQKKDEERYLRMLNQRSKKKA